MHGVDPLCLLCVTAFVLCMGGFRGVVWHSLNLNWRRPYFGILLWNRIRQQMKLQVCCSATFHRMTFQKYCLEDREMNFVVIERNWKLIFLLSIVNQYIYRTRMQLCLGLVVFFSRTPNRHCSVLYMWCVTVYACGALCVSVSCV